MTKQQVKEWMEIGYELEFSVGGKSYSLCPFVNEAGERWVSFCEFYKDDLEVPDVDTLWDSDYQGVRLSEFLSSIPENEIDGR